LKNIDVERAIGEQAWQDAGARMTRNPALMLITNRRLSSAAAQVRWERLG
jgi:hypothetical protein